MRLVFLKTGQISRKEYCIFNIYYDIYHIYILEKKMSKLYFYYGTVCSSKTLNLLAVYKNYELQGRKALLLKPKCDTRSQTIESRAGIKTEPDIILDNNSVIILEILSYINKLGLEPDKLNKYIEAVIVDECQFLTEKQIKELRMLSIGINISYDYIADKLTYLPILNNNDFNNNYNNKKSIITLCPPVMCYGLRTKYNGELWDASSVLMAYSDEIHEIKTVCSFCNKRAVFSSINPKCLEYDNSGNSDITPSWNRFIPVCPEHYFSIND